MLEKTDCVNYISNHKCKILIKKFTECCGKCGFYETEQQLIKRIKAHQKKYGNKQNKGGKNE